MVLESVCCRLLDVMVVMKVLTRLELLLLRLLVVSRLVFMDMLSRAYAFFDWKL